MNTHELTARHSAPKQTTLAVACPAGEAGVVPGSTVVDGCVLEAGYSGAVAATTIDPFYDTSPVNPVNCPAGTTGTVPGSSGTGGTSGCTYGTVPGYSGTGVTATQIAPFYTTDVQGKSKGWVEVHLFYVRWVPSLKFTNHTW